MYVGRYVFMDAVYVLFVRCMILSGGKQVSPWGLIKLPIDLSIYIYGSGRMYYIV